jgi:hypothetical protein
MKTNWKQKALIALAVLNFASFAIAGADGTRGGESVDVSGIPRLRDLVENTTCEWTDGRAMMNKNPLTAEILKRLAMVDWYFAEDLKQEIRDLNYCLTGRLVKIDTRDAENLVTVYSDKTFQAAIRLNRSVYIDRANMGKMPLYDQAFLLIHESIHSYMDYNDPMRNQKLRSMVKAVESVFKGNISTTKMLHLQMENNSINFPLSVDYLKNAKEAVTYVLSDYDARREIILKSQAVGRIFEKIASINPAYLTTWHAPLIISSTLEELVTQAIQTEDVEVLKKLLSDSEAIKEVTLSVLFSSENAQDSEVIGDFLSGRGDAQSFVGIIMRDLARHIVTVNDQNRVIVPGMNLLATNGGDEVPFTSLEAHSYKSMGQASPKIKVFLSVLNTAMAKGDMKLLGDLTFKNPDFYEAFGTEGIKEKLAETKFTNDMEKQVALRKVDTLLGGFWLMARVYLSEQNGNKKWDAFAAKIDQQKLGYEIK